MVVAAILATAPVAQAQSAEPFTSFASAPASGRFTFASWTPRTLLELLQGNQSGETINVVGHLFMPPGSAPVPAVVLLHGSGGIYSAELEFWPQQFNAAGYAVFTLDMFGPRGVRNTSENQSLVPFTADIADAFAALRLLASHPRIDSRRIALMGFSRGGAATLRAAVQRIIAAQNLPDGLRYAAYIPTYAGGCVGGLRLIVRPGVFSSAPILFIHGDADDYTAIGPCRTYADQIGKAGTPVEFFEIEGARHKFDADDQRRHYLPNVTRTKADCPLEFDIDTLEAHDRTSGTRLQGGAYTSVSKACTTTGATVEGNARARDQAARAAIDFLKRALPSRQSP